MGHVLWVGMQIVLLIADDTEVVLQFLLEQLLHLQGGDVHSMAGDVVHQFEDQTGMELQVVLEFSHHCREITGQSSHRGSLCVYLAVFPLFSLFLIFYGLHILISRYARPSLLVSPLVFALRQYAVADLMAHHDLVRPSVEVHGSDGSLAGSLQNDTFNIGDCLLEVEVLAQLLGLAAEVLGLAVVDAVEGVALGGEELGEAVGVGGALPGEAVLVFEDAEGDLADGWVHAHGADDAILDQLPPAAAFQRRFGLHQFQIKYYQQPQTAIIPSLPTSIPRTTQLPQSIHFSLTLQQRIAVLTPHLLLDGLRVSEVSPKLYFCKTSKRTHSMDNHWKLAMLISCLVVFEVRLRNRRE